MKFSLTFCGLFFVFGCLLWLPAEAAENVYVSKGVPALDKEWTGSDYLASFEIFSTGKAPLPLMKEGDGEAVLLRICNQSNLSLYRNKQLPIKQRIESYLETQQGLNSIMKLYTAEANAQKDVHVELAMLFGMNLDAAGTGLELFGEFMPTIPKDDKYEIRMGGLKRMNLGLVQIIVGAEQTLSEKKLFSDRDMGVILEATKRNLPFFLPHFSEDFRKEMSSKFQNRSKEFSGRNAETLSSIVEILKG